MRTSARESSCERSLELVVYGGYMLYMCAKAHILLTLKNDTVSYLYYNMAGDNKGRMLYDVGMCSGDCWNVE